MRRALLLSALVAAVLVGTYRERLFLRDPLGKLERAGVRVEGARIFINYSNDVLVQEGTQSLLVQGWNRTPGAPLKLTCVQGLACLTDQDHAASLSLSGAGRSEGQVEMTDRAVSFLDASGARVQITIR